MLGDMHRDGVCVSLKGEECLTWVGAEGVGTFWDEPKGSGTCCNGQGLKHTCFAEQEGLGWR